MSVLDIWTLYDSPLDFPGLAVLRRFEVRAGDARPTDEVITFGELDEARRLMLERGLTCIPRQDGDDPVIVESWL